MAGGFIAVSVENERSAKLAAAVGSCSPYPEFVVDADWSDAEHPSLAVRTWRRTDRRSSSRHSTTTSLEAAFGADVASTISASRSRAVATADPLGYGALFVWRGLGIAAISTRVEVLAQLAAVWGEPSAKDATIAEGMAYIGHPTPATTGYVGILGVDPDQIAVIENGELHLPANPVAIRWDRSDTRVPLSDLVEEAAAVIVANAARAVSSPEPVVVDLTAGYDSHLILGGLLRAGLAHDLRFQTIGPPNLNDVRVASARCRQLGLEHQTGLPYPISTASLWDRFVENARLTSGLSNPKDGLRGRLGSVDETRVSGLFGELMRGWRTKASRTATAQERAEGVARRFGAGRLSILQADAARRALGRITAEIVGSAPERLAWHAAHRYYARDRLRSRVLRTEDLTPEARRFPLYDARLVEIGLDAMWHHADEPFADLVLGHLAPELTTPPADPASVPSADAGSKPISLMQVGLAAQRDVRAEVFAGVAETESEAWGTIDRSAFRAAVADYGSLGNLELQVLHGAANAVLWLSDLVNDG